MQRPPTVSAPTQVELSNVCSSHRQISQSFSVDLLTKRSVYHFERCFQWRLFCATQKISRQINIVQKKKTKKKNSQQPGNRDYLDPAMLKLSGRVKELTRRRQLKQAFAEVNEAKERLGKVSRMVMNALLSACVHCSDIDSAFQVFEEMSKPEGCGVNHVTFDIILKGLGEAGRLDEAFALLESIERGSAPGNPILSEWHVHTLVNGFVEKGDVIRARGVLMRFHPLPGRRISSLLSYNLLIKGYARSNCPLESLAVKEEISKQGLKPDRVTYNTLILACVKAGKMDIATGILNEMKQEAKKMHPTNLLPNVVTYTTLLKGFANEGNLSGVSNIVDEMKTQSSCVLDRVAYSAIIDAFLATGSTAEALKIFEEILTKSKRDPSFRPKAHVFLSLMRSFAKEGNLPMTQDLHARMIPLSAGNPSPALRAEADWLLMEAAVRGGQISFAKHILNSIRKKRKLIMSERAYMSMVLLQALSGFSDTSYQPLILQTYSVDDPVQVIMLPYVEAKPVPATSLLSEVAMRFYSDDAVPVEDGWGNCIGIVYRQDCKELHVKLSTIMRSPPPYVTSHTTIESAVSYLLDTKCKMVAVVKPMMAKNDMPGHLPGKTIGFLSAQRLWDKFSESTIGINDEGI